METTVAPVLPAEQSPTPAGVVHAVAPRTGGQLVVSQLQCQGVERLFCVPGESFLAVLDALQDSAIDVITCRQEGGAAMMAEAAGKLTRRPGIAFVTRGPGATNAAAGIHIAQQDSTPMILFVGQIERAARGRGAFQEVDYTQLFGSLAKWVVEVDAAHRVPEIVSRAYHVALSGRPGPVVVALPEDMLLEAACVADAPYVAPAVPAPAPDALAAALACLRQATRPLLIAGGSGWSSADCDALIHFAERFDLPVAVSFRRQMLFPGNHPHYIGDLGVQRNPDLLQAIDDADCLLALGTRFGDIASQGYSVLSIPEPRQTLIHVHVDAAELGRVYAARVAMISTPGEFLRAALARGAEAQERAGPPPPSDERSGWRLRCRSNQERWSTLPPAVPGTLQPAKIIEHLNRTLPKNAILTNGAGNYATWVSRYYRFRGINTQLAPTSGSMGYGLPAAIAAKLCFAQRTVIAFAGDGCLMMTIQELATAVQHRAAIVVIVLDNGMDGTIRMHQEMRYPGRVSGTGLQNPDFAALARACGAHGETITETAEFPAALQRALGARTPALIHCHLDAQAITPTRTIDQLRSSAS